MSAATVTFAEQILGPQARRASEFPGAQYAPLDYPGRRPHSSFVYFDGRVAPLRESPSGRGFVVDTGSVQKPIEDFLSNYNFVPLTRRKAVLAIGSNACPGRLEEKYGGIDYEPIIALKGWIGGIDSIYAAWLADYGAFPATITPSANTELETWLTLLTSAQLKVMNESERLGDDYRLVSVASPFRVGANAIDGVYAYLDGRALVWAGQRVRLADFAARRPKYPALSEKQLLAAFLDELGFALGRSIEERHTLLVHDAASLRNINVRLAASHTAENPVCDVLAPVHVRELQMLNWNDR